MEGNNFPSEKTLKQRLFSKDELHHLNVTQVGKLTVSDLLDCIVECLKNALCLSINMAAFKGAEGKLWCELLSSDKYRDIKNYKENMSSHHFSILVIAFSKCTNLNVNSRVRFWLSVVLCSAFRLHLSNFCSNIPRFKITTCFFSYFSLLVRPGRVKREESACQITNTTLTNVSVNQVLWENFVRKVMCHYSSAYS